MDDIASLLMEFYFEVWAEIYLSYPVSSIFNLCVPF